MTTTINANTSAGLVYSADTSGIVKLQSNGVTTNALAWVNFNGSGTVAIRSSYNVSSITDNGTGDYTVNFATALSDANYSANVFCGEPAAVGSVRLAAGWAAAPTTSAYRFITFLYSGGAYSDPTYVNVAIFGN